MINPLNPLVLIIGIFLLIVSIIDWKLKAIPSIMLTGMLFVVAFLNPFNLWFGIMAFILAYLLYEGDFFSGIADIKIMTMIGFMIPSTNYFFVFILLTIFFGMVWKVLIKWRFKEEKDIAFIPVLFFVYITLLFIGGLF